MTTTVERATVRKGSAGPIFPAVPVQASTKIYKGTLVAVTGSGYLVPAANTTGYKVLGIAKETVDNSAGSAGDLTCEVEQGTFLLDNADATVASIGKVVYVSDDHEITATAGNGIVAGILLDIDADGNAVVDIRTGAGNVSTTAGTYGDGTIETKTSGALTPAVRTSLISITGTQAYTLADGTIEGQRKSLRVTVAASTPDGTLTPATFADGTSIDLDAVNESVELEWHATGGWRVIHIIGATITA